MKSMSILIALLLTAWGTSAGGTHTVTFSGLTFQPSALAVEEGDTITFNLSSLHNAAEVSQADWDANNTTELKGGFFVNFGGGTIVISGEGVHYYVCQNHAGSSMKGTITVNPITDVRPEGGPLPAGFSLEQNYPNPFNPSTRFRISVGATAFTEVTVYSTEGKRVRTLLSGTLAPGSYEVSWDGTDERGGNSVSDVYFVRMVSGTDGRPVTLTRKMILLR